MAGYSRKGFLTSKVVAGDEINVAERRLLVHLHGRIAYEVATSVGRSANGSRNPLEHTTIAGAVGDTHWSYAKFSLAPFSLSRHV